MSSSHSVRKYFPSFLILGSCPLNSILHITSLKSLLFSQDIRKKLEESSSWVHSGFCTFGLNHS